MVKLTKKRSSAPKQRLLGISVAAVPIQLVLICVGCAVVIYNFHNHSHWVRVNLPQYAFESRCPSTMQGPGVSPFKKRTDLGAVMELQGFKRGIELGVQRGGFARSMLGKWPNCSEYHLVDLWSYQENYKDFANVNNKIQDNNYHSTLNSLDSWKEKIHVCRNYTSVCVNSYDDEYFDFIYVDARHDFKGVYDDMVAYWPKLKVGGILAGHDYVTQGDGPAQGGQDWTINYDGTKDHTGTVVKGAVDKFAGENCRQVTVSYGEDSFWSWAMRK